MSFLIVPNFYKIATLLKAESVYILNAAASLKIGRILSSLSQFSILGGRQLFIYDLQPQILPKDSRKCPIYVKCFR